MTTEEIDALLAQFAAAKTYAEYMPLRSRVVQALDSYRYGEGIGPSRAHQWKEFERICSTVGPEIRKREYDSIRTYSLEECAAYQAGKQLDRTLAAMQAEHDEGRVGDTPVCRPINETVLVDAVADALGVPAREVA